MNKYSQIYQYGHLF